MGGMNSLFSQKGFIINSEQKNSGNVCADGILWQESKSFTV